MLVEVELRAFDDSPKAVEKGLGYLDAGLRYVHIDKPELSDEKLEMYPDAIWHYLNKVWEMGQNDFQPKEQRSLMVGDIVRIFGRKFKIGDFGFDEVQ